MEVHCSRRSPEQVAADRGARAVPQEMERMGVFSRKPSQTGAQAPLIRMQAGSQPMLNRTLFQATTWSNNNGGNGSGRKCR